MVNVYHELSDPKVMLSTLNATLAPNGAIALVEFRAEDPKVPIKRLHKMSKVQMIREYAASNLIPRRSFDGLPWQRLIFFVPASR